MKICRLCKYPNADKNNYCEECNLSFKDGAVRKKILEAQKNQLF